MRFKSCKANGSAFFNTAFFEALHGSVQGALLELVVIETRYQILTGKSFIQFQGAPDGVFYSFGILGDVGLAAFSAFYQNTIDKPI
ncbi:MAG: hypothetical protein HKP12_06685 [Gammaproteobacteria bacterium]|nr:hypothetical protein [Gammaproteobacteria bacterium]